MKTQSSSELPRSGNLLLMTKIGISGVFGQTATQNGATLSMNKGDFGRLTTSAENSAESLLVAILLQASLKLKTEIRELDPDRSIAIEQGFEMTITRLGQEYTQNMFVVTVQKPKVTATLDPDDYYIEPPRARLITHPNTSETMSESTLDLLRESRMRSKFKIEDSGNEIKS